MARPVVAVPLKPFATAKGRLATRLAPPDRSRLIEAVAAHVLAEASRVEADVAVVTDDPRVADWARRRGAVHIAEPPDGGLDAAAGAAVSFAADRDAPWVIVHGDLPLIGARHMAAAIDAAAEGSAVLAPSRLGGTNLLAASEPIRFRYGPDSFSRHLAATAHLPQRILVSVETLLDLDTPEDLEAAAALEGAEWLGEFLGRAD